MPGKVLTLVFIALWGWPGILLGLLAGVELFERGIGRSVTCRTRHKVIVASAILAVALFTTGRELAGPKVDVPNTLEAAERRQREAESLAATEAFEQAMKDRVKRLKQELATQQRAEELARERRLNAK